MLEVLLHGAVADPEDRAGVAVGAAAGDQGEDLGLALGEAARPQRLDRGAVAAGRAEGPRRQLVAQGGVLDRVAPGLDQVGARPFDHLALLVGVVGVGAAEGDRDHPARRRRQGEGHLVLDPDRRVHLPVEVELVERLRRGHVGEAVGAPVEGLHVAQHQRVLEGELAEEAVEVLGRLRRHHRDHPVGVGADVVERDVVGGDVAPDRDQQAVDQLVQLEHPLDLADQVEDFVGGRRDRGILER